MSILLGFVPIKGVMRAKSFCLSLLSGCGPTDTEDMAGVGELRRLEQALTYVRGFGVVLGVAAVATTSDFPSPAVHRSAWMAVVALAIGTLAIWGVLGRATTRSQLVLLSHVGFVFDALIVLTLVWIFAYEIPYVTWGLVVLLPMEGALRHRLPGALVAAAAVAVFMIPQSLRVATLRGVEFEWSTYIFISGLTFLVAGVVGSMAENWHEQSVALEAQSLRLAEVDQLKDRFLAITSHEIRGPLTAIIAGVDTVQKRGDRLAPNQRERMLEMVATQGHQLARLVDDLLVTGQMQGGAPALDLGWTTLDTVIDPALEAASPRRRGHQLEMFVDHIECEIDRARVSQIVRNLVENAYKYTPEGTPVAVSAEESQGGITIAVSDKGDGIAHDHRDRLFEAFSRIEETAAGQEGVGLGLYVVSQLVTAMHGEIDLASSSSGTTFTISIPCETRPARAPKLGLVGEDGSTA